jgi:hypothetical protein
LNAITQIIGFPASESTGNFDLIAFTEELAAFAKENKRKTEIEKIMINHYDCCKKILVDNLIIQDHKYAQKVKFLVIEKINMYIVIILTHFSSRIPAPNATHRIGKHTH